MVKSKLSYKYIMNCMIKGRLDKMMFMLPEEIRDVAYRMVDVVNETVDSAQVAGDHKLLYELHNDNEGGENYFRTVCRNFYRFVAA